MDNIFFRIFVKNYFTMIPFEKIALIGAGNVSYAFAKALKDNGISPDCVFIRNKDKISEIENSFAVKAVVDYDCLMSCDLIIIAVKDDAIEDVVSNLAAFKGLLLHTSGTQSSSLLSKVENYGIVYPLQTLTKGFDVDFKKVPLLINASSTDNLERLKTFAALLSDTVIECSDDDRRYLHMSAVYVSNFVNVMLQIGSDFLENKGLSLTVLEPLVRETINKSFHLGPEDALTGPARRNDIETINKHKMMLADNDKEKKIYELLTDYIIYKYHKDEKL